jgi:hypothetical protein
MVSLVREDCFVATVGGTFYDNNCYVVNSAANILDIKQCLLSSETITVCYRYEHPIDTVKELADSNLPWVNVHEAWVWSLLDSEDSVSKTLVQHFRILTEEEMTVLSTQGKTAFSVEKLAGGKSTFVLTGWSKYTK